jgi:NADPH:quinone reductase
MKAIQVHKFGGPEELKLEDIPTPNPDAGQVLVRIHAAGVNPYDTVMRAGTYPIKPALPYTPGSDAAGVIEAIGGSVKKVKVGDRVYTARTLTGAYAEYALALEDQVYRLPEKISYAQGAAVFVPYATAYHALFHSAQAHASETALVHGASGGVGTAAVQLAHAFGLTIFGTASSAKGLELVTREGAHQVFDHSKPGYTDQIMAATGGRGVDIIVEVAAHINLAADIKMLATNGRVIIVGSRGEITINPRDLMSRRGYARGFTLWALPAAEMADVHASLGAGMENGTLRPIINKEIALAEARRAHEEIVKPGALGKIVLTT